MKSEALRNLGTMRQVRTALDIARSRKPRTMNSLSRTAEEAEHLESLTDPRLEQVLERERRRFGVQEAAINRSRQQALRAREKLALTVNKNRALTELRRKLQQARWEGANPIAPERERGASEPKRGQVEMEY